MADKKTAKSKKETENRKAEEKKAAKAANTAEAESAENAENENAETVEIETETVPKADYDALNDTYLRLLAEFGNYKKRTEKEKTAIYGDATAAAVGTLLTVRDTLELAAAADCSDEQYKKGVLMTLENMKTVFANLGVVEISEINVPFDPTVHNAVMSEENGDFPDNTVSMVLQKGYKLGDRVIRPAAVKVANA